MRGHSISREQIGTRLNAVSDFLHTHRPLWEPRPFILQPVPWEEDHRDVSAWLRNLTDDQIDTLEADIVAIASAPSELVHWVKQMHRITHLAPAACIEPAALSDPAMARRVPGRKWNQIRAFISTVLANMPPELEGIVDWCAGKGHLGRTLSLLTGLPTTLIEKNVDLCHQGRDSAVRLSAPCHFVAGDVRTQTPRSALSSNHILVSLHACGHLSQDALSAGIKRGIRSIFVASCCYHKLGGVEQYVPVSTIGHRAKLELSYSALRLATADEVVARKPMRLARRREMVWRLGLDLLLRESTGRDEFQVTGPLPKKLLDLSFARFCQEAAEHYQLSLPRHWDPTRAEIAGIERNRIARALGLVRCIFRRPIEMWVVLDRAAHLSENDRPVQLATFCEQPLTPRNILLWSTIE